MVGASVAVAGVLAYRAVTRESAAVVAVVVEPGGQTLRLYGYAVPMRPLIGASSDESAAEVRVRLVLKRPLPGSDDGPAIPVCADVLLDDPIGGRAIVDAETGKALVPGRPPPGMTRASLERIPCWRF